MNSDVSGQAAKDPPLAEQVAPAVAELHAEGHGRNAIARALAVSPGTVSNAARIAGVEFDRSGTEVATRSRTEQLADDRADLAAMSTELARRAGRRLYVELGATVLDPATVTALNRVYGTASDKSLALGLTVTDDGQDEYRTARVWLDGLKAQITAAQLGIIEPNPNGTTPLVLSSEHITPEDEGDHDV